jgi:hypothetical protein
VEEVAVDHDSTVELAAATGLTAYDASYLWYQVILSSTYRFGVTGQ